MLETGTPQRRQPTSSSSTDTIEMSAMANIIMPGLMMSRPIGSFDVTSFHLTRREGGFLQADKRSTARQRRGSYEPIH